MIKNEFKVFVPGRLCLFGEHSDYAATYRTCNPNIEKGYAIACCIKEGIYATIRNSDKFIFSYNDIKIEMDIDVKKMLSVAKSNDFFAYVLGTAAHMYENYKIGGIEIVVDKMTLPIKKGLSSSACICVLIARCFNKLYNLNMNVYDEMEVAYKGERNTNSKCGRMDQICAYNDKTLLITFDKDKSLFEEIKPKKNIYLLFAILNGSKDTKKILDSLNKCYPYAQDKSELNVQTTFGKVNKFNVCNAVNYIKYGKTKKLGKLMTITQRTFDKNIRCKCIEELDAPMLHKILKDQNIYKYVYGGKGIGSGGDGGIQFVAKNSKKCYKLKMYLKDKYNIDSYSLTLK